MNRISHYPVLFPAYLRTKIFLIKNNLIKFECFQNAIIGQDKDVCLNVLCQPDAVSVLGGYSESLVVGKRLSTFCQELGIERIDLLKMDIEGSEYDIIESDLDFISKRVKKMIMEYHYVGPDKGKSWLIDRLSPYFVISNYSANNFIMINRSLD